MQPVKVLVVDDSSFMRKWIVSLLEEDPLIQVVGTANNGNEALQKVKKLLPDVVTMDVEMPEKDGLTALKQLMQERPTPTIMLSAVTKEGADATVNAIEYGAVDFVVKPSGAISIDLYKIKDEIHQKVKAAALVKLKQIVPIMVKPVQVKSISPLSSKYRSYEDIIAIGTSTGGPRALQQVLSQLPADWVAPILIVQHMPKGFTRSLAQRLDQCSPIHVVEAEDGMLVEAGTAYIAPGDYHMELVGNLAEGYRLRIHQGPALSGHRPSVDALFLSLVDHQEIHRHLVLMTGMGSDGAKGMKAAKEAGSDSTIAEAEESCVVYGMPRSAVVLGCVDYTLPVDEIAWKLGQLVGKS